MKKMNSIPWFHKIIAIILANLMAWPPTLIADSFRVQVVPEPSRSTIVLQNTEATNDYRLLRKLDLNAPNWTLERHVPGQNGATTTIVPTNYRPNAFFAAEALRSVTNGPLEIRLSTPTFDYVVGSAPAFLDRGATVISPAPRFDVGQLTISLAANADPADVLSIQSQGNSPGQIGLSGGVVSWGGVPFATVFGGTNFAPLQVLLSSNATPSNVTALLRQIAFQNNSLRYSRLPRTVRYDLTDGLGFRANPVFQAINLNCPAGIDAMVVIDVSFSLDAAGFNLMKQTAVNFVGYLDPAVDRVGLVTIYGGSTIVDRLTNNLAKVRQDLLILTNRSGTIIHPAISNAQNVLVSMPRTNALRLMLILSDGQVNPRSSESNSIAEAAKAKEANTRIIAAGFVNENGLVFNDFMRQLASSPSDYYAPDTSSNAPPVQVQLAAQLRAAARSICRLPNNPPTATPLLASGPEDSPISMTLGGSDPDGDALSFGLVTSPAHGTLSGVAPNLTYSPHTNYFGPDSFQFVVNDGLLQSPPASVSIEVTPVNDPPVAFGQSVTNNRTAFPVTLAGSDVEDDTLNFTIVTPPTNGTLSVLSGLLTGTSNQVVYTPRQNSIGRDSFAFVANDGRTNSDPARVDIFLVDTCAFPGDWVPSMSSPRSGGRPGSVTFAGCEAMLTEGDSFQVSIVRTLSVPLGASLLTIDYAAPSFDHGAADAMRDAFEVAVVDLSGRPLTYTIQGSNQVAAAGVAAASPLPPSPDACFNHTDGQLPFSAPGTAVTPLLNGDQRISIDLRPLAPGSFAKVILRLINNDRDQATSLRIKDVAVQGGLPTANLVGSGGVALSTLGASSQSTLRDNRSSADCPPVWPSFGNRNGASASTGTGGAGCVPPPSGLVAWWPGDGNANDIIGLNHGVLKSGVIANESGKVKMGFTLDGQNDYVDVAARSELYPGTNSFTWCAWIRTTNQVGSMYVVSQYEGAGPRFGLSVVYLALEQGRLTGLVRDSTGRGPGTPGATGVQVIRGQTQLSDGRFHLTALQRDLGTSQLRLFVDGRSEAEDVLDPGVSGPIYNDDGEDDSFTIGASRLIDDASPGGFFHGDIDEVIFVNRALSSNEIAAIYVAGSAGMCKPIQVFQSKPEFLSATGATNATGALPDLGRISGGANGSQKVGSLTFSISPPASELFIGASGLPVPGLDWTEILSGPEIGVSDRENLNVDLEVPAYSIGFEFVEPENTRIAGQTFVDSTFTVDLKRGGNLVRSFSFNAPNDVAAFVGAWTDDPFDRVEIRETIGDTEDEYFGAFFVGNSPIHESSRLGVPTLEIVSPLNQSSSSPGTLLITGSATIRIGSPFPSTSAQHITLVTVNGRPVDALDAVGNFFSSVEVRPGQNAFDVVATDAFNLSTTNTVTVFGTTCPENFSKLGEISAGVVPDYRRTSFNEWTKVLYADVALRNVGSFPVRAPFYVGVTRVSDPSVRVLAADGLSADGIPYYDFSATLNGDVLNPPDLASTPGAGVGPTLSYSQTGSELSLRWPATVMNAVVQKASLLDPVLSWVDAFAAPNGAHQFRVPMTGSPTAFRLRVPPSITASRTLAFHNPNKTQFTYDLVVLGQLNQAPAFTTVPPLEAVTGRTYSYRFAAADPDNDALVFTLLEAPPGLTFDVGSSALNFQPSTNQIGTHRIRLQADDHRGGLSEQSYLLTVVAPPSNRPPFFVSQPVIVAHVPSASYRYDADARDADSDPLTYSLVDGPAGMAINPLTGEILWSPPASQFSSNDSTNAPGLPSVPGFVVENYADLSRPMQLAFDGLRNLYVGQDYAGTGPVLPLNLRRIDAGTRAISNIGPAVEDPDGVLFDALGLIAGIPGSVLVGGNSPENSELGRITAIFPDQTSQTVFEPSAVLGNVQSLRFDTAGRVIFINHLNGNIIAIENGTPRVLGDGPDQSASLAVSPDDLIYFGDGNGTIRIYDRDGSVLNPAFASGLGYSPPIAFGPGGVWGRDVYSVRQGTGEMLRFKPDGSSTVIGTGLAGEVTDMTFGPDGALYLSDYGSNRVLRIAPSRDALGLQPGEYPVTVAAADGRGGVAYQSYRICVLPAAGNRAPMIVSCPITNAFAQTFFADDVRALDPDNDNLTFALEKAPTGMTVNATSGRITWSAPEAGSHPVVVRVTDGRGGLDEQNFTLTIVAPAGAEVRGRVFSAVGESGLAGWTVFSDFNANHRHDSFEPSAVSDTNGVYALLGLSTGNHVIRLENQPGWALASPSSRFHQITLTNGQTLTGIDFGVRQLTNSSFNASPVFVTTPPSPPLAANQTWLYSSGADDADGDPLTFDLVTHPEGMLVETNTGVVAWRPLLSQLGLHEVILRVQDGRGGVALQSWQITVTAPNSAPVITTVPPGPAVAGLPWRYLVRAQDAEGQELTFSLGTNAPSGLMLTNLPTATNASPSPLGGERAGVRGALLSWRPTLANLGSNRLEIVVRDSAGAETRQAFVLEVKAPGEPNRAPQFVSTPRTQTRLGLPYAYLAETSDLDGDPITFTLVNGQIGMTLTNWTAMDGVSPSPGGEGRGEGGLIFWTPATLGTFPVVIAVNDGRPGGVVTQAFNLTVSSTLTNVAPIIVSLPPLHATAGQPYAYDLAANDADGDPIAWRLVSGPAGASLDAQTGALRWHPTLDQLGTNIVTVEARDALLATATQTWAIEVSCLNRPPEITSIPPTQAHTEQPYLYALRASDPDGDTLTFAFADPANVPSGLALSNLTTAASGSPSLGGDGRGEGGSGLGGALLRWTPGTNQSGPQLIRLRVRDGRGGEGQQDFVLNVIGQPANNAPYFVSMPVTAALALGNPLMPLPTYLYDAHALDSDGDTLTYALVTAPTNMTMNPTNGLISWAPGTEQVGTHPVMAIATDGRGGAGVQNFLVRVIGANENHAPVITSAPRTNATPGAAYRYNLSAFDSDGDVLTFALTNAPVGMAIDRLGRITWIPGLAQVAAFPVAVTVTDPFGASATQSFSVTVTPDTEPPVVSLEVSYNLFDTETGQQFVQAGTSTLLRVRAADDVGVASLSLLMDGANVPLGPDGSALVQFPVAGDIAALATATDGAGNTSRTNTLVRVVDPNAQGDVHIIIHSPTNGVEITRPTEVFATIYSTRAPLRNYSLEFAELTPEAAAGAVEVDHPALSYETIRSFTAASDTLGLTNISLGKFDTTRVLNGAYVLRVSAFDRNGKGRREGSVVFVAGELKFGEFGLNFTDLQIPVAGIPITVSRVYDTRDSKREGDFGYGWSLGVQNARIAEVPKKRGAGLDEFTFTTRTRVYLNTPNGRRVGFSLVPQLYQLGFFGATYLMKFKADPGVYDVLESDDGGGAFSVLSDGSIGLALFGGLAGYDPSTYRLRTKENLVYEYGQSAGLERVTDPNGNRLEYTRDGIFHYQAGAATPDQSVTFQRDARGRIQSIIDPNGKALRYVYDGAGDLRSFTDQVTNVTRYAYSSTRAHFLTNIVDPLGRPALSLEYDASGALNVVRDGSGNPLSQDFDSDLQTGTFTDGNGNVTTVKFDDRGNETVRMLPGVFTNYFHFDANNNLLASTNGRGFATNYTYDARGNVTSITDSLSNRTTIVYNALNKPEMVVNALGQTLHLSYNGSGQLTQVVNNAGLRTAVTRDSQGRVASLTDATGTNSTTFDYTGGCACGRPGKVVNPDGSFRLYEYNQFGQTNRVVNELGAETVFHYGDDGRLLWMRDALTNFTQFFYDGPLLTNVVDALGRSTRYEYDALNRTNKIINAEGGVIEFRYDKNGNRTHVIDAVTNVTEFVYDAANRLDHQIDPLGQTNFFKFDAAGNRTEAIDRNGRKRTFRYDALNRMTNELWWEGTNVVHSIEFAFNELGIQTLAADPAARYDYRFDALNRLEQVVARSAGVSDFTLAYTYSALGQVQSVTDNWGVRVGSSYDNRNRLASRTWSSSGPEPGVDPARVDFAYDVTGNRTRTDRSADLAGANRIGRTTNAYNHAGIVTNITHLGPASQVLARYDLNFDAAYQIRRWAIANQISDFDYDRTGQLTNAQNTAQPNENFRYDANGNRVGAQSGGSYVVGRNNQILGDGTNSYAYDAEGNMTSRSNTLTGVVTLYNFDHRNRLVSVIDRNPVGVVTQTVAFVYDAMNRRLSKTVSGQRITNNMRFLYNGDDSWADLDSSNVVTARYLHGARIDELLARQRATDGRGWYLTDHLGTVRDIASATGTIAAHLEYSSFGHVLAVSNPMAVDRFLFTGRELDGDTGLYFYRARYISEALGRFISEDPIGFSSKDFNLNRYAMNAPLSMLDPFGTSPLIDSSIQISTLYLRVHTYFFQIRLGIKILFAVIACEIGFLPFADDPSFVNGVVGVSTCILAILAEYRSP